jgi:hypothetical protein
MFFVFFCHWQMYEVRGSSATGTGSEPSLVPFQVQAAPSSKRVSAGSPLAAGALQPVAEIGTVTAAAAALPQPLTVSLSADVIKRRLELLFSTYFDEQTDEGQTAHRTAILDVLAQVAHDEIQIDIVLRGLKTWPAAVAQPKSASCASGANSESESLPVYVPIVPAAVALAAKSLLVSMLDLY